MREKINDFKKILSPLENDILKSIWPDRKLRVREIYNKLKGRRKLALSSVAVLLDRLHEKGIVKRKIETARGGVRYVYYPAQTKEDFEKKIIETTVDKLIQKFGRAAVVYFNERFKK